MIASGKGESQCANTSPNDFVGLNMAVCVRLSGSVIGRDSLMASFQPFWGQPVRGVSLSSPQVWRLKHRQS